MVKQKQQLQAPTRRDKKKALVQRILRRQTSSRNTRAVPKRLPMQPTSTSSKQPTTRRTLQKQPPAHHTTSQPNQPTQQRTSRPKRPTPRRAAKTATRTHDHTRPHTRREVRDAWHTGLRRAHAIRAAWHMGLQRTAPPPRQSHSPSRGEFLEDANDAWRRAVFDSERTCRAFRSESRLAWHRDAWHAGRPAPTPSPDTRSRLLREPTRPFPVGFVSDRASPARHREERRLRVRDALRLRTPALVAAGDLNAAIHRIARIGSSALPPIDWTDDKWSRTCGNRPVSRWSSPHRKRMIPKNWDCYDFYP